MDSPKYVFSRIPNNFKGRLLIKILKEFLNSNMINKSKTCALFHNRIMRGERA